MRRPSRRVMFQALAWATALTVIVFLLWRVQETQAESSRLARENTDLIEQSAADNKEIADALAKIILEIDDEGVKAQLAELLARQQRQAQQPARRTSRPAPSPRPTPSSQPSPPPSAPPSPSPTCRPGPQPVCL